MTALPAALSLHVVDRPVADLGANPRNARTHDKKQVRRIADSLKRFGFVNPVLISDEDEIVAGHGRLAAARLIGLDQVPTIRLSHLSDAERRAYVIADNRLAELAGWDLEILAIELGELLDLDLDLDLEITGFEMPEIDLMIQNAAGAPSQEDPVELEALRAPVSRPGDLWLLGPHRLFCGDARDRLCLKTLMGGERAAVVFTDPPYNVPIPGNVSGLGAVRHEDFAMASGEMSRTGFTAFLEEILGNLAAYSISGSLHYVCMDRRHMEEILAAGRVVYTEMKNLCVWNKDNGGMGSLYRSKHELVFVFKSGDAGHVNNIELGRHGRNRTNVWDYPGVNTLRAGRTEELSMHPTVKPTALIADALLDASKRGDLVLDSFGGSGSTLIAAEQTGRRGRLVELEPRYVDVTIRRWEKIAGESATLAETQESFETVAMGRRDDAHEQ